MNRIKVMGITVTVTALACALPCLQTVCAETKRPIVRTGVVGIQLRERGALLIEDFKGDEVDEKKWRIWHSDPEVVQFSVRDGRFETRGEGHRLPLPL